MSLRLARGEMVGLIGPNGAGETTLFNLISGNLKPTSGEIRIAGRDASQDRPKQRIRLGVGRTFQILRPFTPSSLSQNSVAQV
ncbi:ABC transporter [Rhizobium sp. NFR03]|nr:ABC transporter [Rhizobium sp. NFR03]